MARARNIKPGFCQNEHLAELPVETRLLFALLPMFADRDGRLEDRPKRIGVQVFPYDGFDADAMLQQLHDAGFVLRYTVDDSPYIQIVNFSKHQNPHVKEAASTIPAPDKHSASTVQAPDESGSSHADSLNLVTDSLNLSKEGAAAPTFWDVAVGIGVPRALIGKLIKQHSEAKVAEAIAACAIKRPADARQFLVACLQERPAKLFVPKDDAELVPFAKANGLPEPGKTETYHEYRQRLWPLVKERNGRMTT